MSRFIEVKYQDTVYVSLSDGDIDEDFKKAVEFYRKALKDLD